MNRDTVTKSELIDLIFERVGLTKSASKIIVNAFFEEICNELISGREINFSGFGNFQLINKKERVGRNPKTGIPATILARRVVTFHPSKVLKKNINT